MSKEDKKDSVIVTFEEKKEILEILNFEELLRDYRQEAFQIEVHEAKKRVAGLSLRTAVSAAEADTVLFTDAVGQWTITNVEGSTGNKKLDKDKLKENLGKMGKLDSDLIEKIFAKSMVPAEDRKDSIRVTPPKAKKAAK